MALDPGGGLAQIPQPRRAFLARAIRSSPQIEAAGQLPLSLPTPSHCRHGTRYLYWRPKFDGTHSNALPWMPAGEEGCPDLAALDDHRRAPAYRHAPPAGCWRRADVRTTGG